MMGGAGAGAGEKPQERERQTWLAEDEAVWGTDVDAGSGVIGRLDEDSAEEMLVTSVPGQERLHPAVPRRRGQAIEAGEQAEEPAGTPSEGPAEASIAEPVTT